MIKQEAARKPIEKSILKLNMQAVQIANKDQPNSGQSENLFDNLIQDNEEQLRLQVQNERAVHSPAEKFSSKRSNNPHKNHNSNKPLVLGSGRKGYQNKYSPQTINATSMKSESGYHTQIPMKKTKADDQVQSSAR